MSEIKVVYGKNDLREASYSRECYLIIANPFGTFEKGMYYSDGIKWNKVLSVTSSSNSVWGSITGTLSNQTDLQSALDSKYDTSNPDGYITTASLTPYLTIADAVLTYEPLLGYTPYNSTNPSGYITISSVITSHLDLSNIGTNTHIQIDSHIANTSNPHSVTKTQVGLSNVPNTDCTSTANISDSTNKRFVTDVNLTVIGNTSGTNTGDNATNSQYSGDYRSSNFVAGTNYLAPNGSAAALTSFPTLNQNTSGTAANLSGTPTLPNGTAVTTQSQGDNSTKIASTAYVDAAGNPTVPYIATTPWYGMGVIQYSVSGSGIPAINTLRAYPYLMTQTITVAKLGCAILASVLGKIRLIVWNDNGSMYPGTVLYDSQQLAAATASTLSHTPTSTLTLNKGTIYWFGQVCDGICLLPAYPNRFVTNLLMGYSVTYSDIVSYIGYSTTSANAFANGAPTFPAGASLINNVNLYSFTMFQK